jgi:hypothetical protein
LLFIIGIPLCFLFPIIGIPMLLVGLIVGLLNTRMR